MSTPQTTKKDDLIVIGGAGGFIGGSLTRYFHDRGLPESAPLIRNLCRTGTRECLVLKASAWT
jgi:hypothetical protein